VAKSKTRKLDQAGFAKFTRRMREAGLPEVATLAFERALEFVSSGGETTIPESAISAVDSLPALADLADFSEAGRAAASKTAVIKLNGGLGTSMGLSSAKSLLPVRPETSFLDLIARQTLWHREEWGVELPLVLMNSFRTRKDSLAALRSYADLETRLPLDFLQHKVPRIDAETWTPVDWPKDESLGWCPPGHGDLYLALASSGMLEALRSHGIRYAFVSNADNLGAVLDSRLLGWFATTKIPFAMEVAVRTESDRKGGHLAHRDGRLILREVAQCPESDFDFFQDIGRHHYFNTNNLWLDLDALAAALNANASGLSLPVILNEKRVSSEDPSSPLCYQLETAMGSAIECFEGAEAIVVPRERFAPVKTTNDLLSIRSDAYRVTHDARVVPVDETLSRVRTVELDPRFFGTVNDLERAFPEGPPSLARCRRFSVSGPYLFGADVSIEGSVALSNLTDVVEKIPSGTILSDDGKA
jgi:UTP--glucose-1-phosphate uridylyltransferase